MERWTQVRQKILERDNHSCTCCREQKGLEVHHIIPRLEDGTDDMNNLTTLCKKCHRQVEPRPRKHISGKRTTIIITKDTRDKLMSIGRMADTYDDIINRLLGGKQ